jgi:CRISPR-associated protein Csb1
VEQLLADSDCLAVNLHQELAPVGGWDVPVSPPLTNRAPHDAAPGYAINGLRDGTAMVSLDSVASQAQRMAAVFHGSLAGYVPKVEVAVGDTNIPVTALPNGLTEPAIRTSDLDEVITAAFRAYADGDPLPIAAIAPTTLVYGAFDADRTRIRIPRLLRSEIQAWDVDPLTQPAPLGDPRDADPGAYAPEHSRNNDHAPGAVAADGTPDGVMVHGRIKHTATLHFPGLRQLEEAHDGLATYVLGLALGGLWRGGLEYNLRPGCELVRQAAPSVEAVYRDSRRTGTSLNGSDIGKALLSASAAARQLELPLGEHRLAKANAATRNA